MLAKLVQSYPFSKPLFLTFTNYIVLHTHVVLA
jgi:hypothetical protein